MLSRFPGGTVVDSQQQPLAALAPPRPPAQVQGGPASTSGFPPGVSQRGGDLNFGASIAPQTYNFDCGPASARIVLQGNGVFQGQGARQAEDTLIGAMGTGQGGTGFGDVAPALNKFLPQANYRGFAGSGGSPDALLNAISTSIDAGFGAILNYNATGRINAVSGTPPNLTNPQHFVAVRGYNAQNRTVDISDPAGGQQYTLSLDEAYRLSQARGVIAAAPAPGVRGPGGPPGQQIALRSQDSPLPGGQPAPAGTGDDSWMRLPAGWDPTKPIPQDVRQAHGIPDNVPPMFYASGQAPNLANVAAVPGSASPTMQPGQPNLTAPNPTYFPNYQTQTGDNFTGPFGSAPGQAGYQGADAGTSPFGNQSPIQAFSSVMSSVGSIAGDAFTVFGDVIKSIGSAANITDQMVRGFANTNDVMNFSDQMQTFITTAADISKLVSDTAGTIGQFVGAGSAADPSGATAGVAAAFGAVSAISGLVSQGLQALNEGIDLTQEAIKQVMKVSAKWAGNILGGPNTGDLTGNVRMLLNTNTNQLVAYSEDNPQNQAVHNLPQWLSRAYGGPNPNAQPNTQTNILNQYVGPGQTPVGMMSDSMWLISTGAPAVASVAGQV
jgi:Peptidase_C39 like family